MKISFKNKPPASPPASQSNPLLTHPSKPTANAKL